MHKLLYDHSYTGVFGIKFTYKKQHYILYVHFIYTIIGSTHTMYITQISTFRRF